MHITPLVNNIQFSVYFSYVAGTEQIEEVDSHEDLAEVSEIILVPEEGSCIQTIYEAIKVCQVIWNIWSKIHVLM